VSLRRWEALNDWPELNAKMTRVSVYLDQARWNWNKIESFKSRDAIGV
jgi:hypothetical protein